jgi:O-antigen/teichoic acid export membrane protein
VAQVHEESAVLIWSGTSVLLFVAGGWWMTRSARTWPAAPVAVIGPEAWIVAGLPLLAISVLHVLLDRLGIVMLGYLGSTTDAGIYSVAGRFAEIISFGLAAVNSRLGPTIAAAYDRGRRDDMQRAASTALRLSLLIACGTCLVLVPFGKGILRLYGTAFVAGYAPLLVLLAGQAINAACGSVGTIMVMTSHRAQLAMVLLASLAANAILNTLLIPRFGMLGAASATAASMAAWNLALLAIVHRRLRIRPGIL